MSAKLIKLSDHRKPKASLAEESVALSTAFILAYVSVTVALFQLFLTAGNDA